MNIDMASIHAALKERYQQEPVVMIGHGIGPRRLTMMSQSARAHETEAKRLWGLNADEDGDQEEKKKWKKTAIAIGMKEHYVALPAFETVKEWAVDEINGFDANSSDHHVSLKMAFTKETLERLTVMIRDNDPPTGSLTRQDFVDYDRVRSRNEIWQPMIDIHHEVFYRLSNIDWKLENSSASSIARELHFLKIAAFEGAAKKHQYGRPGSTAWQVMMEAMGMMAGKLSELWMA